jgi:hypothetical protein
MANFASFIFLVNFLRSASVHLAVSCDKTFSHQAVKFKNHFQRFVTDDSYFKVLRQKLQEIQSKVQLNVSHKAVIPLHYNFLVVTTN